MIRTIAVSLALLGLTGLAILGQQTTAGQTPGATYEGSIGSATVTLTLSDDGATIRSVKVEDLVTYCFVINIDIPDLTQSDALSGGSAAVTNGSFSFELDQATYNIKISGAFAGGAADGLVSITDDIGDPDCSAGIEFVASQVGGTGLQPTALPSTGDGPGSANSSSDTPWGVIAGALAMLGFGAGGMLLVRRQAR